MEALFGEDDIFVCDKMCFCLFEDMKRKCNRLQQKLHKTSAKSPAFTAFLIRIVFLSAIWEVPVLLMPRSARVFAHAATCSLTPHHAAVLLSDTQGRAALQVVLKEACSRAVTDKFPDQYSLRKGKAYNTEGSEEMDAFNK